MARLILDQESIGLSFLMERITKVKIKDCFKDDEGNLYFVVDQNDIGKAIGKGGMNIHRAEQEIKRKIKIIAYSDSVIDFVRNIIHPLRVQEIIEEGNQLIIKETNKKAKSLLMGRNGKNLKLINRAVKRFFNHEIKVI
mgnify:FL=1